MHSTPPPRTILVVDDHDAHRRLLEMVLGAHNYRVISASDGHEALTYLQFGTPDAIILDVHMPDMSGFDVARRVRRLTRLRAVPILIMTSAAGPETRGRADEVGASAVIYKPIAGIDLDRRLRTVLA
jgi:PleD family two-component response regulator